MKNGLAAILPHGLRLEEVMAIEYLGLQSVNGPFVVLEGVKGAAYDEIVEIVADGKDRRLGRIVEINEDKAVVQVLNPPRTCP